ncbi:MAG: hypothetical protein ACM3NH_03100 [Candidatus Saccharibacteria bacterium]
MRRILVPQVRVSAPELEVNPMSVSVQDDPVSLSQAARSAFVMLFAGLL